jgi:hypothetical protein
MKKPPWLEYPEDGSDQSDNPVAVAGGSALSSRDVALM